LLLYSSNLALEVSNWPVIYFINYTPTSSLALFITAPSGILCKEPPSKAEETALDGFIISGS
jgi:hypothetical protein